MLEVHLLSLSSLRSQRALIKKIINLGQVLALVGKVEYSKSVICYKFVKNFITLKN